MAVTGIIAEFDPFHGGHLHLIEEARRLVPGTDVICVMSGSFTQRGAPASADKLTRAASAAENGADLVFELPVSRALAPAPVFGDGGVRLLAATGVLTHLAFGSECGRLDLLLNAAECAESPEFSEKVRFLCSQGMTYARAVSAAYPLEAARVLEKPNDLLAAEYIRALKKHCPEVVPVPVLRVGAAHGSEEASELPSASYVRRLALGGIAAKELPLPENVRAILSSEEKAGRFPFDAKALDRAVLAVIQRMARGELEALPEGGDGLANRIMKSAAEANSVEELCAAAKSRNYTLARVRRCVWQAFLGITREDQKSPPRYLRVLAIGKNGRELLRRMEKTAAVPIITKPAFLNHLDVDCRRAAELEARADSLRSLGLGRRADMFRQSPFVLK